MNFYSTTIILALILTVALGLTITVFSRRRFTERILAFGIIELLVFEISWLMIFRQEYAMYALYWGRIAISSMAVLLPTWLVIAFVYARENYRDILKKRAWVIVLVSLVGLVFSYIPWKIDFLLVSFKFPETLFRVTLTGKYFLVFSMIVIVLILLNLESTIRSAFVNYKKGRKSHIYLLMLSFLFSVFVISQQLMYARVSSRGVITGFIFIILTNSIFILNIVKNGLLQLEVQIGREVVYSSATIFIIGVYLLIIGIAGKIVQVAGGDVNIFLSFLAAFIVFALLLAILVSKSLKVRIRNFVDRNVYKNKYDYREQWGKFSESLAAVFELDEMIATIIENIVEIFSVNQAAILLTADTYEKIVVYKSLNLDDTRGIAFRLDSKFIDWIYRLDRAVDINRMILQADTVGITGEEIHHFKSLNAEVCVPMVSHKKFIGFITLGKKNNESGFTEEDFELLETLANQSSISIINSRLSEDLVQAREVESFHKLSSFVLHDLKNSVTMLSMIIQNAEANIENPEFQKDMLKAISNATSRMKGLISKMSSLPDKLELRRQKISVNDLIEAVLHDTKIQQQKAVQLEKSFEKLPEIDIDPELFKKVIQNLLINAIEALPAGGRLQIVTAQTNGQSNSGNSSNGKFLKIEVTDSGTGMTEDFINNQLFKPFKTTKKKGLGIGLYHCREIVLAHGGTIEVESRLDEGTSFKVFLPVINGCVTSKTPLIDDEKILSLN